VDDVEVAAQQFARHVRIDVTRIEQRNAVAQFVTFNLKLLQFGLALGQQAVVLCPGEQPARPGKRHPAHEQQAHQGDRLGQAFTLEFRFVAMAPHAP
jgi:hypothetical protein